MSLCCDLKLQLKTKNFLHISKDDLQNPRKIGLGIGGGRGGGVTGKWNKDEVFLKLVTSKDFLTCLPCKGKLLTLAFYHVSCVGLTIFCCLFCSVHREKHWHLMKNACKRTISKAFFDCHWNQPELFIWNFTEGLTALLKRGKKNIVFWGALALRVSCPLFPIHVFWGWRKNVR